MEKLIIRNGTVYDPMTKEYGIRDVAVCGREITDIKDAKGGLEINAEDCLLIPGLIDFHVHCFEDGSDGASNADMSCLPNGVTTCVDGGTAGSAAFESFYRNNILRSVTSVRALLHVAPEGLATGRHPENQSPQYWDREKICELVEKYKDHIAGIKVRMSENILSPFGLKDEPLTEGIKLAEEIGKRVVVHVNNPNVTTERIASLLRTGDVFCHAFAGTEENILGRDHRIKPLIMEARERGVLFDACNGRGNYPDIISSDMNPFCYYKQPLITMPRLLSKYLAMGMELRDVIDRATAVPAAWLAAEDLATLREGTVSDLAIFKLVNKEIKHMDFTGESISGRQVLVPQLTVKGGSIVYCQSDFN